MSHANNRRHWQAVVGVLGAAAVIGGLTLHGLSSHPAPAEAAATSSGQSAAAVKVVSKHRPHHRLSIRERIERTERKETPVLRRYRDVLAGRLDPSGEKLQAKVTGGTYSTEGLGTKLDWNRGGMLEIYVSSAWDGAASFYDLDAAGMQPTTVGGLDAQVSTTGDDTVVSVKQADGSVVTLIASTSFGNNGSSTSSLGLSQQQLLQAASDSRLALPAFLR
ncbi:MAG: hypothetical protein QM747_09885 [Nocardioides sp.]